MTIGKTLALTIQTFVGKTMSLLLPLLIFLHLKNVKQGHFFNGLKTPATDWGRELKNKSEGEGWGVSKTPGLL